MFFALLAVISSIFNLSSITNASTLQEKQQWLKNNSDNLTIHTGRAPLPLASGGPDAYGYFFIDSEDSASNKPIFLWKDISAVAETLSFNQDDQILGPFPIGFAFSFYGQLFGNLYICSNGYACFSANPADFLNDPIPNPDAPNNMLAPFWDDLTPDTGSRIFFYSNRMDSCIITWNNFGRYSGEGRYTFQIILTAGKIIFQYLSMTGVLDSHTIGIENTYGTIGLQYVYNSHKDESGTAIYFGPMGPRYAQRDVMPVAVLSPSSYGGINDTIRPLVRFYNGGMYSETFNSRLMIYQDTLVYDQRVRINLLAPTRTTDITFPNYIPPGIGQYHIVAISELSVDQRRGNDTLRIDYSVYPNIYRQNFEASNGNFIGNNDWQWGRSMPQPVAHSGINDWATNLDSNYTNGPLLSSLVSDTINLGTGATMSFWHWYDIENLFDGGNVKISTDNGLSWNLVTPEGGYDGIIASDFQNPLGGQPGFYGYHRAWSLESFDLSEYSAHTIKIKFDFGADNSYTSVGWYIDDLMVVGTGRYTPGWITGIVTDLTTGMPVSNASVICGNRSDSVESDGRYFIELMSSTVSLTANAIYHNTVTIPGITIPAGDTIDQDIALPSPRIQVDTASIYAELYSGDTLAVVRQIFNNGSGNLDYTIVLENASDSIWLSADPVQGTIEPYQNQIVTILLDLRDFIPDS